MRTFKATVLSLGIAAAPARADEIDDLRAQVEQARRDNRSEEEDNLVDLAIHAASADKVPLRLGRIELFAAELDAERPTPRTAQRAKKAVLHLGADPAAHLAAVRWHTSGARVALTAGRLGGAALHLQLGRTAIAQALADEQAPAATPSKPLVGRTDVRRDALRLDELELTLLARLRQIVQEKKGDTSALTPDHLAAIAALANGQLLAADHGGDDPLPPSVRLAGEGLVAKLDRALALAEEREIAQADARGDAASEKAAAMARSRHAETLLRLSRRDDAIAERKRSLAWYREHGTLDQVVAEARWIAERAGPSGDRKATFAARREEVREIQLQLGKLFGPARAAAYAKYRADFVALVGAAAALSAERTTGRGAELLEAVDLVRDRAVWDQAAALASGARWRRLGGEGVEVRKMLEAIAEDDRRHRPDERTMDEPGTPATRARQRAIDAMMRGEPHSEVPPLDGAAIAARVGPRTLLVYGRIDEQHVAIGGLRAKGAARIVIAKLAASDEAKWVGALRRGLREGGEAWHEPARSLHAALIAPIESQLGAGAASGLMIVPDGALAAVPFAALENAKGKLLGERATIALSPSLAALSLPLGDAVESKESLVLGVPGFAEPGTPPLPTADSEAAAIKQTLAAGGRKALRLVPDAAAAQLLRANGRYDVLHLVTRARLDAETPLLSAVLLASAPLLSFDLGSTSLRANIITLDIAPTVVDLPPLAAARSLSGIVGGALAGPARTVVLATASTEGPASGALLARFYERVGGGEAPSLALAAAQREMATSKLPQPLLLAAGADPIADAPRFRHPRYWAGFTVWGEP